MSNILYDEIPSLDLAKFTDGSESEKEEFVEKLGAAYQNIGFVAIRNHGLSDELTKKIYDIIQKFFSLPEEVKNRYARPELFNQRGYVGKGKEHAKGRNTGDLKEFYHVGQDLPQDEQVEDYPENVWPDELAEFKEITLEVYRTLESTALKMLNAIARYLDLPEDYFADKASKGNSILRPIHYYPIANPDEVPEDAVRAAEHGDINLITLLMGASADGLQVLRRDNVWIPITALPEQIIVNVGDMLARLTNDRLKSTIHRVVNPPRHLMNTSRYSIPFFMHPRSSMDLSCLPTCISDENPKKYADITAGDFLNERLQEIGLKKV
jgi:isopenicillin N synthase-like dioxygenase